jgi:phosphoenolpyruvate carboxykinase (GTP)
VEKGVFGIIRDVNADDDPVIFDALTRKCEVIFSNVLVKDAKPYWLGMGKELPKEGFNHSGEWYEGKKDDEGKAITPSHKNARYCLNISELSNRDPKADDPEGVPLGGVVYGGRDSDTWAPVEQAFNWREGIIAKGASIESETTAATLGQEGIRKFNIMSNMDFLSIPMGEYIQNNIDFGESLDVEPSIFSVNYFLKNEEGKFLNDIADKIVWIMWAERRVNNEVKARKTPTGYIPEYEDLVKLFREYRNKDYTKEDYEKQFTVRIPENLAKIDRIEKIYKEQGDGIPKSVFDAFEQIRQRYAELKEQKGEYVSPFDIPKD